MTKFDQIWYFIHIYYRLATFINPFFVAVQYFKTRISFNLLLHIQPEQRISIMKAV